MPDTSIALEDECFFIAPIGSDGSPERKRSDGILEFIVGRAADELGLKAVRADKIAEPGQITLQVIGHVLGAKAAVVDLTDLNPNVFYELAIRHTAALPVALIAEKDCNLPFDIAQMRTIFFDHTDLASADQCRKEIVLHLREALNGSADSPISTSLDVRAMQTGSAVERSLADVVTTLEDLGRLQRGQSGMIEHLLEITTVLTDRRAGVSTRAIAEVVESFDVLLDIARTRQDEEMLEVLRHCSDAVNYFRHRLDGPRPHTTAKRRPDDQRRVAIADLLPDEGRDSAGNQESVF